MKTASANEIKQKLKELDQTQLAELCLRLSRFKKENKELLHYLLFEADDDDHYVQQVKDEMAEAFGAVNTSSLYFAKKNLRKILRNANKHIRYTGNATAELEILIHFVSGIKDLGLPIKKSAALLNLYNGQLKKITTVLSSMHEDIQYDYQKRLAALE